MFVSQMIHAEGCLTVTRPCLCCSTAPAGSGGPATTASDGACLALFEARLWSYVRVQFKYEQGTAGAQAQHALRSARFVERCALTRKAAAMHLEVLLLLLAAVEPPAPAVGVAAARQ